LSYLQKLIKHGFLSVAKLETCQLSEDPPLPASADGYVVSFMALYERVFRAPPHQFLRLLMRYYGIKLYHLTPSGVLHITVFVTLCEAYLGIIPNLDRWKYFFRVCRPQDPEAELRTSGSVVIHVKLGYREYPYLEIPMPTSMKGWRKKWFYLKNDDSAPLLAFTSGHPVPLAS
jgi:hypothetical protein